MRVDGQESPPLRDGRPCVHVVVVVCVLSQRADVEVALVAGELHRLFAVESCERLLSQGRDLDAEGGVVVGGDARTACAGHATRRTEAVGVVLPTATLVCHTFS